MAVDRPIQLALPAKYGLREKGLTC